MDTFVTPLAAAQTRAEATNVDVTQTPLPFDQFYADSGESIVRAVAATIGDLELAAEAVDEAMTRAVQRWPKISRYDNPAGWVYRVALNWSLSRRQRRRRERQLPPAWDEPSIEPRERDDSLDHAMQALSIEHRSVVVCRIYFDWSVRQTADALDIAEGTVKSRFARALDQLRDSIEQEKS